ncbi:hybrid sensor histidine kinase/response regulator [Roseibium sp.]|uniref:ATP-binding response regulator n=1 Tax=Roseibium sp. TaxID=1936156 RepID=UPI003A9799D6
MVDQPEASNDFTDFRVEQARLLKDRVVSSCVFVLIIIWNAAAMLAISGDFARAALWAPAGSAMVAVTYAYARLAAPEGITRSNVYAYLRGHVAVTCVTGLVWSAFAIYNFDAGSQFRIFISVLLVLSITLGGMLPSSAYRPGYIGLAICTLVPFGLYVLTTAPWPMPLIGLGTLVYFAFGMFTSARAELNTREAIAGRFTQDLMAKIVTQNEIIRKVHEEKTKFLAATSHDLSQPLHAQGYFIQLLKEKLRDEDNRKLLARIEASWRGQSELLRGLVEINRLDSGSVVPEPRLTYLRDELENLLGDFDALRASRDISLTTDLADLQAEIDPVLLSRIIRNLVGNAIKYTDPGGAVTLSLKLKGTSAEITVSDDGPGISPDDQERIFKEYVQLGERPPNASNGLGLGLSIVQRLVTLLAIDLSLQSEPGRGTTFILSFPAYLAQRAADRRPSAQIGLATPLVVVLVDDDKAIRDAVSDLMTHWGCQVLSAPTGEGAVSLLDATDLMPDLLIVDNRLADGETGPTVIEQLRDEVNETIPAVLISGDLDALPGTPGIEDLQLLGKPVEPRTLRRILNEIAEAQIRPNS